MVAKLVKVTLLMLVLSVSPAHAQKKEAMEKEREQYMEKQMDQYRERVDTFVKLLHVDDFKGQIIKQKIDEFYEKRHKIYSSDSYKAIEKESVIEEMKISHFADVSELYSEETISSIHRFLSDNKTEIKKLQKTKTKKNN
ncbi:hypothetical protein ES711_03020 [Gelidibacter salicanalis]|uniref:Uncharacterized protein n=1 Tax=Gelidibacter salicanalis TaxID=291193 RepID=A0A5C7AQD6_9FLAO|nr:hypothetical protein [Gelidibacter salicanalis]TXE10890.1 hypothetical protein ES711_03020 [Gelidibacter salicanalis]